MISYNMTTAFLGIATVLVIFYLIRRNAIYIKYTFWWLGTSAAILLFSLFPQLSDVIVQAIDISYPPALLFFCAILLLFMKILLMDIERSKQEIRLRRLVQRLAIIEAQLEMNSLKKHSN